MLKYSQRKFMKPKQGGGPNDSALHANKRAQRDAEQCGKDCGKEQQQAGKDREARGRQIKIKRCRQKNSAVKVILGLQFANKFGCLHSSLSLYVLGNNAKCFHLSQQKRQQKHACKHTHSCAQKQPNTAQIFLCRVNDPESKSTALSLLLLLTSQRCLRCSAAFTVLVCLPRSRLLLLPPGQWRRHLGPSDWIPPMLWLGLGLGPYLCLCDSDFVLVLVWAPRAVMIVVARADNPSQKWEAKSAKNCEFEHFAALHTRLSRAFVERKGQLTSAKGLRLEPTHRYIYSCRYSYICTALSSYKCH